MCAAYMDFGVGKFRNCLVDNPILIVPLRNSGRQYHKLVLCLLHVLYHI